MAAFILGQKTIQSRTFTPDGKRIPYTFIKTSPSYILDIIVPEKRGYFSVKLGFGQAKNIKKPVKGEIEKAGIKTPLKFLREFRLDKIVDSVKVIEENKKVGLAIGETKIFAGDEIKPSILFKVGDLVSVTGTSKGKGFQGVVRRHHFAGGPRTHGQSDRERAPGAIGSTTTPGRVFKGKRMAGRMGGERVTLRNLQVIEVTEEGMKVKGLVPGAKNGLLEIRNNK